MTDKIEIGGNEIFMSYGLLTELARLIPDLDNIPGLVLDSEVRDQLLTTLLIKRDEKGRPAKDAQVNLSDLTIEQSEELIDWAQTNLLDFFLRRAQKAMEQTKRIQEQLAASSSAGSQS